MKAESPELLEEAIARSIDQHMIAYPYRAIDSIETDGETHYILVWEFVPILTPEDYCVACDRRSELKKRVSDLSPVEWMELNHLTYQTDCYLVRTFNAIEEKARTDKATHN